MVAYEEVTAVSPPTAAQKPADAHDTDARNPPTSMAGVQLLPLNVNALPLL